jgi:hypothetical protein
MMTPLSLALFTGNDYKASGTNPITAVKTAAAYAANGDRRAEKTRDQTGFKSKLVGSVVFTSSVSSFQSERSLSLGGTTRI